MVADINISGPRDNMTDSFYDHSDTVIGASNLVAHFSTNETFVVLN